MNSKKLAFNIAAAGSGMMAVITYFVCFFEREHGMHDLLDHAFRRLDIEELSILFPFFIVPSILAMLNGGLGFAMKKKGSGIFSIITGAIGIISVSAWFAFSEANIVSWDLDWGAAMNSFMFVGCLVCGILTLALVRDPVAESPVEDMYQPPMDYYSSNDGYDAGYGNNDYYTPGVVGGYGDGYNPGYGGYGGMTGGDDSTVRLNQDNVGFTPAPNYTAGSIFCVNGKYRGISFPISHGERVNIGRDPRQCNIIIGEESIYVGRKHCNVVYFGDVRRYEITVSSSNGIILSNGRKVRTGETVRLAAGTTIALGNNDNVFELR